MANYKIESVKWESEKEEFGIDSVIFVAMVIAVHNSDFRFPLMLPYREIIRHASIEFPTIPKILDGAQKYINGWGPHESKLIAELEECGFNMSQLAQKAFESYYDIDNEGTRVEAMKKTSPEKLEKIVTDLEEYIPGMKMENVTYFQLCELLEGAISDAVIKQFPVLINSSSDNIRELNSILVDHIPDLASDLQNLIEKANDE